jgi:hypothetical protein
MRGWPNVCYSPVIGHSVHEGGRSVAIHGGTHALLDDKVIHSDAFCAETVRDYDRGSRMIRAIPRVMSLEQHRWSFRSLFTFLNELSDDWGRIWNRIPGSQHLKLYSADQDGKGDRPVTMRIDEGENISVQISRADVVVWDNWEKITTQEEISHRTRSTDEEQGQMILEHTGF